MHRMPRLKWHKLRQRHDDLPFSRANLAAGLLAGAALEVDLSMSADGAFVCIHDATLDRETTGTGPVARTTRAELAGLRQRGPDGRPTTEPLVFLDDVVNAVAALRRPPGALVQLDVKEPSERLDDALLGRIGEALGDHAPAFIIGSCDAALVARLPSVIPGVARGYDPYDISKERALDTAADFRALGEETVRLAPDVQFYYLYVETVLAGLDRGVNLVELVRQPGSEVDVWTLGADRADIAAVLRRVVDTGADQITTYDPIILTAMLKETA